MQVTHNGYVVNGTAADVAVFALQAIESEHPRTLLLSPKQIKRVRKYMRRNWVYEMTSDARYWYCNVAANNNVR